MNNKPCDICGGPPAHLSVLDEGACHVCWFWFQNEWERHVETLVRLGERPAW